MPQVKVELKVEELAQALKQLTPGERETLLILLNPKLKRELKERWKRARGEFKSGKTLTEEELF
ncbi:MAG: hypothetical protein NZO41_02870 [Candidatus Bipolaricaulota bacterium]|nr:hypothetical protein [Candidatus Bipolaricaulota bacterium]MDW8141321.1 hypothetical protein [Candidatus Bipolaricaulota bacterium]